MSNWRDIVRPIIHKVITDNPGKDINELRKLISEKYPFGQRQYHPYKVWLDEIKIQLKVKRFGKKNNVTAKEQIKLF